MREKIAAPRLKSSVSAITRIGQQLNDAINRKADHQLLETIKTLDCGFEADYCAELASSYWLFFEQLKMHVASENAWANICVPLNIALLLCEQGIGEEHTQTIISALDSVFKAKLRGEKTGTYRLDGAGIRAVSEALTVHDAQMELATKREVLIARDEMHRRLAAGNVYSVEKKMH